MTPSEVFNNYIERGKYKDVKSLLPKHDKNPDSNIIFKTYEDDNLEIKYCSDELKREGKSE